MAVDSEVILSKFERKQLTTYDSDPAKSFSKSNNKMKVFSDKQKLNLLPINLY